MSSLPAKPALSPQLRLFSPADIETTGTTELSADMTLSAFFEAHVKAHCLGDNPRNLKQHRESLRYWEAFTGGPALRQLDVWVETTGLTREQEQQARAKRLQPVQQIMKRFLEGLAKLPGRNGTVVPATIRKHCVEVQYTIDRAGPWTREQETNACLLRQPPLIKKPAVQKGDVDDVFALDEVGWFLEACDAAEAPQIKGVKPRDWWRALAIFDINVGPRVGTLIKLRYDWIFEERDPRIGGTWIDVPGWAMKKKQARKLFLNEHALAAINSIRTDRELIFEFPHTESWLHENRRRILAASQIPLEHRFGFHAFRKCFSTELAIVSGDLIVSMALGHSLKNVAVDHYMHRRAMADAMRKLPQPKWRRERMLFD